MIVIVSEEELLQKVKAGLGIVGTYQEETITIYINEVKEYLVSAGVSQNVIQSRKAIGVICRGVADLWNYGSGKLSDYFMQRATQLAYEEGE